MKDVLLPSQMKSHSGTLSPTKVTSDVGPPLLFPPADFAFVDWCCPPPCPPALVVVVIVVVAGVGVVIMDEGANQPSRNPSIDMTLVRPDTPCPRVMSMSMSSPTVSVMVPSSTSTLTWRTVVVGIIGIGISVSVCICVIEGGGTC